MIVTPRSNGSVKSTNPLRPHSDLPPSYDAAQAQSHDFIDGEPTRGEPFRIPPEPLVTGDPSSEHPLPPLYLDPTSGEPSVTHVVPNRLLTQCTQHGHIERVKFGTLSIFAAAFFFPWGLLCLIGSRTVYCERCGLVLRAPGLKDSGSRPTYYSGKRRAHF